MTQSNKSLDVRAKQLLLVSESILFDTLQNRVSNNVSLAYSHNISEVLRLYCEIIKMMMMLVKRQLEVEFDDN